MKSKNIILWVLGGILILSIAKDVIIQSIVSGVLSKALNVPISIGSTQVNPFSGSATIRSLRIQNPKNFKDRTMLDMPLIHVQADLSTIGKERLHIQEVRLNLKELIVCKNKDGRVNLQTLKQGMSSGSEKKNKSKSVLFQIDRLDLTIDKVIYRDYSVGGDKPQETVFELGLKNRIFTNVANPSQIAGLIMVEALTRTTLTSVVDLDLGFFKDTAAQTLRQSLGLVGSGSETLEKTAKGVLNLFK